MTTAFTPVETPDDRARLAALADEIWHEYWPALIGEAQTDYMVERFQSLAAIERDMAEHAYEYWFLQAEDDGRIVGYTGGHVEVQTNRFFISKIYLLAEERGRNELGSRAYLGTGFRTIDAVETDIGNGFIMDDYIMEKRIEPLAP